ncbi:MAG: OsmC family protein [Polyangiales bacterium]
MKNQSYAGLLATSERVAFRLEDVLGAGATLDFGRPFMPAALAGGQLPFLSADERRTLNQIRGHAYLHMFGLVEQFILPFVVDHVRPALRGERARALLQFAGEEAKHIALFERFAQEFARGFGSPCEGVGPAHAIADAVLAHAPLGVALAILHVEWMTQRHFLESVDEPLDVHFRSLLKHHYREECQHARLDELIVRELASELGPRELASGIDDYFSIVQALDGLLIEQVKLDLASFERAARRLGEHERALLFADQLAVCRFTFLGSGMSQPNFVALVRELSPGTEPRLRAAASKFSETKGETMNTPAQNLPSVLNGIDLVALQTAAEGLIANPGLAAVTFRAKTRWQGRLKSSTEISSYDLGGQTILRRHQIEADEPVEILGENSAPNPQDLLLAALAACMSVGFVAGATKAGITLEALEIDTACSLDLRGAFGLDPHVQPHAGHIKYTVKVRGNGTREQFEQIHREVTQLSPNYNHLANPIAFVSELVVAE